MAKTDDGREEYDIEQKALQYGTIRMNALFDKGPSSLKFSRAGGLVDIRIPWVTIIWGGAFALLFLPIGLLVSLKLLGIPGVYMPVLIVLFGVVPGFLGAKLGAWSPMQSSTGEDLLTYVAIVSRQKMSAKSAQPGKQSTCELVSRVYGGEEGQVVKCTRWIGTQPLYNAPPMSLYADDDFKTDFYFEPRGETKVIDNSDYRDGMGDRSLG